MEALLRVLVVEDNPEREERLKSWLPSDVRPVVATSAGAAIGTLRLDSGFVYAAVMLDHDLQERAATQQDSWLSGRDVVKAMIQYLSRDAMVLIHSANSIGGAAMTERLRNQGFDVTRISMNSLTKEDLGKWIDEVRKNWEDCNT